MLQYPYPIRLTPIWGKTMRQLSERFYSCRTQQEYTQVGIKIFRFFRTEGSNRFPDRRRIPTCEARHGDFGQPRFRRLDGIAHGMIAFCRRRCSFPQFVGTADLLLLDLRRRVLATLHLVALLYQLLKKSLVHIIIGRNRDVRDAFLLEPGRSIWHLFQTDFTEIMLLF